MRTLWLLLLLGLILLGNCAAPRPSLLGSVYMVYPENRMIDIELKSFSFQPNHIAILQNQYPLTFRLTNTADIKHNFTLKDSQKNIITSIDLMPEESKTVTIESLKPGNYLFYCDRFLHRLGGMEGMLMVAE